MIEVEEMNITTKNFVPLFRQMLNNLTAAEFRALGESVGLRFREPITCTSQSRCSFRHRRGAHKQDGEEPTEENLTI